MYTAQELEKKYQRAYTRHLQWFSLAYQAFLYVTPQRECLNEFYEYTDPGVTKETQIYSSIPQTAAIQRANKLVRMLMPDNEKWGNLKLNTKLLEQLGIQTELTDEDIVTAVDILYDYLHSSDLAQQSQDAMVDECVGAGALWIESESDDNPIVPTAVAGFCVMPEYYQGGKVGDLHYPFSCSRDFIINNYPEAIQRTEVQTQLDSQQENDIYWVHRSVVWDWEENPDKPSWRVVDRLGSSDQEEFILKSYFTPYKKLIYFRDRLRPGEVVGRGPAINYLPEIERLNTLTKLTDQADELRAFPPMEGDTEQFTNTMMTNMAGSMFPEGTGGRFWEIPASPAVSEKLESLTQRIQKGFGVDPIGGLNQPVRTAAEVGIREADAKENTTIDVSRLLKESSAAVFETCFEILLMRGRIPKSAEFLKLKKKAPAALLFSYVNPLGDIEKNNNLLKVERSLQMSQQYFGPQGFMAQFNLSALQNFLAQNSGVPITVFKDGSEMQAALTKAVQQVEQQQPQNVLPQPQTTAQQVNPLEPEGVSI